MIKKTLILLFVFCTIFVYSQKSKNCITQNSNNSNAKFYLDITTAVSAPFGDFAKDNLNGGSYAIAGFTGTAQLSWMAFDKIGFRLGVSATISPVDAVSLAQDELAADEFMEGLSIRSESYSVLNVFGAILYQKELSDKFNLTASLGAGMIYMETPHQLYRARHYMVGNNYFEVTAAGDYTIMYTAGIETEYKIRESWSLIGGAKFNYAKAQFQFVVPGQANRIDERKISMLDVFVGFRLFF